KNTHDNDVTLIKLKSPATINSHMNTMALPRSCPSISAQCLMSRCSNTGLLQFKNQFSSPLQGLDVPILSDPTCHKACPGGTTSCIFCVDIKDSCQMSFNCDSSGPVVCSGLLQDVLSWGPGCALKGKAGIYAKVCNYLAWIQGSITAN
uniref:trypsin n=1 Tax=Cavia porcellus TaxID=10141 RepID=H0W3H9_CAVPO